MLVNCTVNWFVLFYMLSWSMYSSGSQFEMSLSEIRTDTDARTQQEAVKSLIYRTIGNRSVEFEVSVNPNMTRRGSKDAYKLLKSENGSVVYIEGTSGVAAAWGFHHYLKYYCFCHISWDEQQINLPSVLPPVTLHITANDRFRYYQNVCTTSYSFVWWDWAQWERHIDWMALNGINMALAFNAQEAIWQRVYSKLNLTQQEIDEHFTGPAFFSWGRMGNMRGWAGPLSAAWHSSSLTLQKQILARMRSLGIVPILPAFAGHVPRAFKRIFPNANLTLATKWNGFEDKYCCPYLVLPQDPLFQLVGSMFLEEMISEFGTDHIYNCDTFNEIPPSSGDLDFLRNIGRSIFRSMTQVDPNAVWMLQAWVFYNEYYFWTKPRAEAMLTSVPLGKMIVLDLMSELNPQFERLDSYFGQPYIWCMLHNFGGTLGMHGTATRVNEDSFKARALENSTMVGTGLTMEGIYQNYVIYDLMLEMGWRKKPADLDLWFNDYSTRRFGEVNTHLNKMWQLLRKSVYNYTDVLQQHGQYIVVRHPSLRLSDHVWYNQSDVMNAWDEMMVVVESASASASTNERDVTRQSTFKHDLVDVTRQAMQLKIDFLYRHVVKAFFKRDLNHLNKSTSHFLEVMSDLNKLLASNKWFLLGPWLESAKRRASSPQEKSQFEENARNQITLWGPNGEIRDYACKQWAHLMTSYYIPRWQFFFDELKKAVINKTGFNQQKVSLAIFREVEQPFTYSKELFPTFEIGDSVEVAKTIHKRWRHLRENFDSPEYDTSSY